MNEINADHLLAQIRTLGRDLQVTPTPSKPAETGFGDMLKDALGTVNEAQQRSHELKIDFQNGTTDKSLAEVMIAAQKADISFRAVTEVRNKLITAYQDIMNMPV